MLREEINNALKDAMKASDKRRVSTLRLINAEILRRETSAAERLTLTDAEIRDVMGKMIRQRQESLDIYEKAGRAELAAQERLVSAIVGGLSGVALNAQVRSSLTPRRVRCPGGGDLETVLLGAARGVRRLGDSGHAAAAGDVEVETAPGIGMGEVGSRELRASVVRRRAYNRRRRERHALLGAAPRQRSTALHPL